MKFVRNCMRELVHSQEVGEKGKEGKEDPKDQFQNFTFRVSAETPLPKEQALWKV